MPGKRASLKLGILLLAAIWLGSADVAAQTPAATPPPPAAGPPAIEPDALALLKEMGTRLAAAKSLRFIATDTFESPARNGQPLYYTTISNVTLQRQPDRLRIITPGDGPPTEFYYDGKRMIAYDPAVNLAAIATAPPSLDAMAKQAFEKAGIYWPFVDVLVADPYKDLSDGLKSAFVVGESRIVGGVPTYMVALAKDNVQLQIWIGQADKLPRMVRGSFPNDPTKRRFETQFANWTLGGPVAAGLFASPKAEKAPRMPFAHPATDAAKPQ